MPLRVLDGIPRTPYPPARMQRLADTSPEIAEMVRARLMALSGAECFLIGVRMFEAPRCMTLASLPSDLPEPERKRLLFERFYGMPLPTR